MDHLLKNTDRVEFDTFLEAIISVLGDKDRQSGVNKIFDFYDPAHTGFISFDNLRRVAQELGEEISDADLADMIMKASSNGSEISREDFYLIFTKRVFP
jgi:Ca2+-binding EF-hand superfamily protein